MLCVDVKADDIRSYTTRSAVERKQIMLNVQSKRVYERIVIALRPLDGERIVIAYRSLSGRDCGQAGVSLLSVGGRGCGMAAAAPCLMI